MLLEPSALSPSRRLFTYEKELGLTTSFKRRLLILAVALSGWLSTAQAGPSPWNPQGNAVTSNVSVSGTNYDFTYFTGTYAQYTAAVSTDYTPWGTNASQAQAFSQAYFTATGGISSTTTGGTYGTINTTANGYYGAVAFAYTAPSGGIVNAELPIIYPTIYYGVASATGMEAGYSASWGVVQLSGGAPEIDGSLAPKVGFLLGCLFLMFGRKKQNTEPMMTA